MQEPIVVTGGTGALGRVVVSELTARALQVRVVSRRAGSTGGGTGAGWTTADLVSGDGVAAAVAGAGAVIHCATSGNAGRDVTATGKLIEAARRAGGPHLVYISIVGVDRVPLPYYRGKLATEELIEGSGLPYTILRATQFHDLLRAMFAGAARLPVMFVPALAFQPVDVRDVAARLAELAVAEPAGRAPDLGGPQVRRATDLARGYLRETGRRRVVAPVRLPGRTFRAYRQGGHLAAEHADGRITFEQYLAAHTHPRTVSYRAR